MPGPPVDENDDIVLLQALAPGQQVIEELIFGSAVIYYRYNKTDYYAAALKDKLWMTNNAAKKCPVHIGGESSRQGPKDASDRR